MQPIAVAETSSIAQSRPYAHSSQRVALDVWPAAGGGLLVSLAHPILRAAPPARRNLAGFFLKICSWGEHSLSVPYVSPNAEAQRWLVEIVGDELNLAPSKLTVMERPGGTARETTPGEFLRAEWHFRAVAAMAKDLLLEEAAFVWSTFPRDCSLRDGMVLHTGDNRAAPMGAFASGASLQPLLGWTRLRSGKRIGIAAQHAHKTGFSHFKNAWLNASIAHNNE